MSFRDESLLPEAILIHSRAIHDLNAEFRKALEIFRSFSKFATKNDLRQMEGRIMATQADIVEQAKAQLAELGQIGQEVDTLVQTVKDLQAAVGNQTDASPELVAAVQAVSDQMKIVDDKVPNDPPVGVQGVAKGPKHPPIQ